MPREVVRSSVTLDDEDLRSQEFKRARIHTKDDSCEPAGLSDVYCEVAIWNAALGKYAFFDEPRRFMRGWEATIWIAQNPPPPHPALEWLKVERPATARLHPDCVSFDSLIKETSGAVFLPRLHHTTTTKGLTADKPLFVLLLKRLPAKKEEDASSSSSSAAASSLTEIFTPPASIVGAPSRQLACFPSHKNALEYVSTLPAPPRFSWHTLPLDEFRAIESTIKPFTCEMIESY